MMNEDTLKKEYDRLTDDVMDKISHIMADHCIPYDRELSVPLCVAICNCVIDALHFGEECRSFPYEVAEQDAKVEIVEQSADKTNTHYFWKMIAGFADAEEANSYLERKRRENPGKKYGGFADGIAIDFDD